MDNLKIILIMFITVTTINSCILEPEPYDCDYKFVVLNSTNYQVNINIYYNDSDNMNRDSLFSLNPNSEVKYEYIRRIPGNAFDLPADSAYITFDNIRRIIYRKDDGKSRNIIVLDGYNGASENEYWYKFVYTITDDDYANATPIE